jgi:nucleoside-diphosphate-sugar epimerase
MKYVITGCSDLALFASNQLSSDDTDVVLLNSRIVPEQSPAVSSFIGDLRDETFVNTSIRGAGCLIHLAQLDIGFTDSKEQFLQATHGTYQLFLAAQKAGVERIVLGSTLELFQSISAEWEVNEYWRPRPAPNIDPLCAWLSELTARQVTLNPKIPVICLRFGHPVYTSRIAGLPYDPLWVDIEDCMEAIRCAIRYPYKRWAVFHIPAAGSRGKIRLGEAASKPFFYQPKHSFDEWPGRADEAMSPELVSTPKSRPIEKVVLFGAGGPLAAAAAKLLSTRYQLRLTDRLPLPEIAALRKENNHQLSAPIAVDLPPPHEFQAADITQLEDVLRVCEGMDAVINCSVIRSDPFQAFAVNALGVFNIAQACQKFHIRRIVQTGPQLYTLNGHDDDQGDYSWQFDITEGAPPRPGKHLYGLSKYLGQETARTFAETLNMEVAVLLFDYLIRNDPEQTAVPYPFLISWEDAARAIFQAVSLEFLPEYEVFNITLSSPMQQFRNQKAKEILKWQPEDDLTRFWYHKKQQHP